MSYVLGEEPRNKALMWIIVVILFFGFWDTFILTFQIEFLEKILVQNPGSKIIIETK